jgi:hypothetical protein
VHQLISRIESELDQIRSMCQQLEQAERSNQQLAQQLQSTQSDLNLRTQLQNMAQKEAFNAQKLQQISQIVSQARQQISQLRQPAMAVHQPPFQQPPYGHAGFQSQQTPSTVPPYQQPAGTQAMPSSTQVWVQRHTQPAVSPNQALNILQQGVPQPGAQPAQAMPPVQSMPQPQPSQQQPPIGPYRSLNPSDPH